MGKGICRAVVRAALAWLVVSGPARPCFAESGSRWKKVWAASVGALATANVLDARSSAGRYEANPLLRDSQGRFSPGRAAMIKSAASGGVLLLQLLLRRKMPEHELEKPAAVINFATAAALGATAYRNTRTPRGKSVV